MSDTKEKEKSPEEQEREQRARDQNAEGGVPEQRPQAATFGGAEDGEVRKKLIEAESPLANVQDGGMDQAAYDRADSDGQKKKAAKTEKEHGTERLFPGAHAYIDNEDGDGSEHHGRAVAVNRVAEWNSQLDQMRGTSGDPEQMLYAKVRTYEVMTRDGRAEILFVSGEHLRKVGAQDYHKTQT